MPTFLSLLFSAEFLFGFVHNFGQLYDAFKSVSTKKRNLTEVPISVSSKVKLFFVSLNGKKQQQPLDCRSKNERKHSSQDHIQLLNTKLPHRIPPKMKLNLIISININYPRGKFTTCLVSHGINMVDTGFGNGSLFHKCLFEWAVHRNKHHCEHPFGIFWTILRRFKKICLTIRVFEYTFQTDI